MIIVKGVGNGKIRQLFPKTERKKDYQKSRVYNAEFMAEERRPYLIRCSPIEFTDGAVFSFMSSMNEHPVLKHGFGKVSIPVRIEHSNTSVSKVYDDEVLMYIRDSGISAYEILHEIAHVMQGDRKPDHGVCFASIFLFLVNQVMGKEYADELQRAFVYYGVAFNEITIEGEKDGRHFRHRKATKKSRVYLSGKAHWSLWKMQIFASRRSRQKVPPMQQTNQGEESCLKQHR